ncbi:MAG: DNA repair protein RadC [Lachnospiraceae bacterium]|nr:DNA repair protein RadC [Lachnospiraceae bacterium]
MKYKMRELPECERPYEKCELYGTQSLSDAEILSVILRNGTKELNSLELAISILNLCGEEKSIAELETISLEDLRSIKGIGRVKALQIKCLVEFSKRMWKSRRGKKPQILSPEDCALWYMESMKHLEREEVHLMMLDAKSSLIEDYALSIGTVNASLVSPREVYLQAVRKGAVFIIMVHNHPSGSPNPSQQDIEITEKLKKAGKLMDIELIDSIIIGDGVYVSLKEIGLM